MIKDQAQIEVDAQIQRVSKMPNDVLARACNSSNMTDASYAISEARKRGMNVTRAVYLGKV